MKKKSVVENMIQRIVKEEFPNNSNPDDEQTQIMEMYKKFKELRTMAKEFDERGSRFAYALENNYFKKIALFFKEEIQGFSRY